MRKEEFDKIENKFKDFELVDKLVSDIDPNFKTRIKLTIDRHLNISSLFKKKSINKLDILVEDPSTICQTYNVLPKELSKRIFQTIKDYRDELKEYLDDIEIS